MHVQAHLFHYMGDIVGRGIGEPGHVAGAGAQRAVGAGPPVGAQAVVGGVCQALAVTRALHHSGTLLSIKV